MYDCIARFRYVLEYAKKVLYTLFLAATKAGEFTGVGYIAPYAIGEVAGAIRKVPGTSGTSSKKVHAKLH